MVNSSQYPDVSNQIPVPEGRDMWAGGSG